VARKARSEILYNGCYAHVFSRSIEKRKIFKDEEDFEYFKKLLSKEKIKNKFNVFHYCLMQTHFHLAVEIGILESFSAGLQQLKWQYTRRFNEKYKRWGPLWRERFKSMLIENECYMYACGIYIELNPVKVKMVTTKEEWKYSSARHYQGICKDDLIDHYNETQLPDDIDMNDDNEFLRGFLIGSGWFKYKKIKGIA